MGSGILLKPAGVEFGCRHASSADLHPPEVGPRPRHLPGLTAPATGLRHLAGPVGLADQIGRAGRARVTLGSCYPFSTARTPRIGPPGKNPREGRVILKRCSRGGITLPSAPHFYVFTGHCGRRRRGGRGGRRGSFQPVVPDRNLFFLNLFWNYFCKILFSGRPWGLKTSPTSTSSTSRC
jgi:hypothetical protein